MRCARRRTCRPRRGRHTSHPEAGFSAPEAGWWPIHAIADATDRPWCSTPPQLPRSDQTLRRWHASPIRHRRHQGCLDHTGRLCSPQTHGRADGGVRRLRPHPARVDDDRPRGGLPAACAIPRESARFELCRAGEWDAAAAAATALCRVNELFAPFPGACIKGAEDPASRWRSHPAPGAISARAQAVERRSPWPQRRSPAPAA